MTEELEWSGLQQVLLLAQSALLGIAMGAILDGISGIGFGLSKIRRFFVDVFFCVLMAPITFFYSLVMTDGRLHPAMFAGIVVGAVAEHLFVGRKISRFISKILRFARAFGEKLHRLVTCIIKRICSVCIKIWSSLTKKAKKVKKTRKKPHFFQKKS